ncbi:hypothetical protein HZH68_005550 [Vespula germanica]|uniref:Uncharacterized protein n=1 Tax=Vespula germanica TaxID=30212 RepID=A0A834KHW5_VESGE|nr:hypothetical protein HZH68_005550 [Vespula germanica]
MKRGTPTVTAAAAAAAAAEAAEAEAAATAGVAASVADTETATITIIAVARPYQQERTRECYNPLWYFDPAAKCKAFPVADTSMGNPIGMTLQKISLLRVPIYC